MTMTQWVAELTLPDGVWSGVNGTPTFFINGVRHDGSYQLDVLLQALERTVLVGRPG